MIRLIANRPCSGVARCLAYWPMAGLVAVLLIGGCGYQQKSLYRANVQTVAVPVFSNRTMARGVEMGLSKAVVTRLEQHSPYKVMPRERADAILEGEVTSWELKTLGRDFDTGLPTQQELRMTVDFVFKDLRSGQQLVMRRDFEATTVYYPTLGEGQFVGQQQAIERLALAIVQELQADW